MKCKTEGRKWGVKVALGRGLQAQHGVWGTMSALQTQLSFVSFLQDFDAFDLAVEDEKLNEFLKLCW